MEVPYTNCFGLQNVNSKDRLLSSFSRARTRVISPVNACLRTPGADETKTLSGVHFKEVEKNDGESISKTKNIKDGSQEKNKHKMKRKLEDVDFEEVKMDGNEAGEHSHNCERKKRKKEKKKSKDDSSFLQQEKMQDNVEVNIEFAEHDGNDCKELKIKNKKKKKMKREKKNNNIDNDNNGLLQIDEVEYANKKKKKHTQKMAGVHSKEVEKNDGESISKTKNIKDGSQEKNKHKMKRKLEDVDFEEVKMDENEAGEHSHNCERKKRKKEKKKSKDDSSFLQQEKMPDNVEVNIEFAEHDENDGKELKIKNKKKKKMKREKKNINIGNDNNGLLQIDEVEYANKKKKKHTQIIESGSKPVEKDLTDISPSNKKVRFSGLDEVFPIPGNSNIEKDNVEEDDLATFGGLSFDEESECVGEDGLVRGKRFSPEEDATVKAAVLHYIEKNYLGDEGLKMVLNCKSCPQVRGCWKEIGSAIPYRPYTAIYYRAQILFRRSEMRKWTEEEYDLIRNYQKENGNEWKALADELGRHRFHVKDTWRRIKLNQKKGHWSQDEYQKLFNLVNLDLQAKLSEDKVSKHGMLRDNICWTAISDELSTRSQANCCIKWYKQLTSRMVADGVWADKDDYRLIDALYELDATCVEDVDWDALLENRPGDLCRKRWNQMVLHIGHHGNTSFSEQVEVLAQRYCPNLVAAREAWDSKPRVAGSYIRRKNTE